MANGQPLTDADRWDWLILLREQSILTLYKPDPKNFNYLLDHLKSDFGVEKGDLVHVAQSLFHDHGPARDFQLQSVWVNRQGSRIGAQHDASWVGAHNELEKGEQDVYAFQLEVKSLGELAAIVDAAFGVKS